MKVRATRARTIEVEITLGDSVSMDPDQPDTAADWKPGQPS